MIVTFDFDTEEGDLTFSFSMSSAIIGRSWPVPVLRKLGLFHVIKKKKWVAYFMATSVMMKYWSYENVT